jgi:hypothetical protein
MVLVWHCRGESIFWPLPASRDPIVPWLAALPPSSHPCNILSLCLPLPPLQLSRALVVSWSPGHRGQSPDLTVRISNLCPTHRLSRGTPLMAVSPTGAQKKQGVTRSKCKRTRSTEVWGPSSQKRTAQSPCFAFLFSKDRMAPTLPREANLHSIYGTPMPISSRNTQKYCSTSCRGIP